MNQVARKFPEPSELDTAGLAQRDVALAVARAVAERHPGPQYDHKVDGAVIQIDAKHPAHNFTFGLDMTNPEILRDPTKRAKHMAMEHYFGHWQSRLLHVMRGTKVTNADGHEMSMADGIAALSDLMRKVKGSASKFIFVGNGGSAGICSHMAVDFTKNGGVRAETFNDSSLLTCFANDFGYANVFGQAVASHGRAGDMLVALSSSGKSENILNAVDEAKVRAITPVTFSGFDEKNPLRKAGTLNFYVPSNQYGFVETAHAAILHATLDIFNGWVGQP